MRRWVPGVNALSPHPVCVADVTECRLPRPPAGEAPLQPLPFISTGSLGEACALSTLLHTFVPIPACRCWEPPTKESFLVSLYKKKKKKIQEEAVGLITLYLFLCLCHADGDYSVCQCLSPFLFSFYHMHLMFFLSFSFSVSQKIKQGAPNYLLRSHKVWLKEFVLMGMHWNVNFPPPTSRRLLCCSLPVTSTLPSLLGLPWTHLLYNMGWLWPCSALEPFFPGFSSFLPDCFFFDFSPCCLSSAGIFRGWGQPQGLPLALSRPYCTRPGWFHPCPWFLTITFA